MKATRADTLTPGFYPWYVLGVLVLVCTLSFVDRQALSILAEQIKADLSLTDTQLGLLYGTLFAIFYTVFGIPLGRLVDNWRRVWVIGAGLGLWSLMTLLSGLANSYAGLAFARMGVGVGEATASPAAFSILAAYFVHQRRALAMGTYTAGVYLGMGLSLALVGWISTAWDATYRGAGPWGLAGWQATFIVIGLPGLLAAAWVLTLREPPRLDADGRSHAPDGKAAWRAFLGDIASFVPPFTIWSVARIRGALPRNLSVLACVSVVTGGLAYATGDRIQWAAWGVGAYGVFTWSQTLRVSDPPAYRLIWGRPAVPLAVLGTGCLAIMTYAISFWTAPFALRTFGVSAAEAGAAIGIPGAIASAVGVIVGGVISDAWKRRNPRGRIFTCMIAAVSPVPAILVMFRTPDYHLYLMLSPLVFLLANLWAGSIVALFQDLVLPRMFGTVGAVYMLGSNMIGLALGPYVSGKIATVTGSLQIGIFSLLVVPAVGLTTFWLLGRHVDQAERTKLAQAIEAGEPVNLSEAGGVAA